MDEAIKKAASIPDKENLKNTQVLLMAGMGWGRGGGNFEPDDIACGSCYCQKTRRKHNF